MELRCDNCGFPIRGFPARIGQRVYCCLDCAEGGPCNCKYTGLSRAVQPQWLARRTGAGSHELAAGNQGAAGRSWEPSL